MIARTWHGVVPVAKADAYWDYLNQTGIPDYKATPGNMGVTVLRRIDGEHAHFLIISYWESMSAIHAFAGQDVEEARYYPRDVEFLLEHEPKAFHYEVLTT